MQPIDLIPLAATDRVRWASLRRSVDRHRFATGRALLAKVASQMVGDLAGWYWSVHCDRCLSDRHGPVDVTHPSGARLQVSLSHSADRVVVAASTDPVRLGVDVESLDSFSLDATALADQVFASSERAAFDAARRDEPDASVQAWWVRKESVLKAARIGLTVDPSHVVVSPPSAEPRLLSDPAALGLQSPALYDLTGSSLRRPACLCVDPGPAQVSVCPVSLPDPVFD